MRYVAYLFLLVMLAGCTVESAEPNVITEVGPDARLGSGPVVAYTSVDRTGTPLAIGVRISSEAMDSMPESMSDAHHCFDRNNDGAIATDSECIFTHERVMALPSSVANRADVPFDWVLFNWNPAGHHPPGIYDAPHFDIHFMIEPVENIMSIDSGPCGPEFVRCDHFERARTAVPAEYVAPDFQNVDAIVPAMGNHLIDVTSPELHGEPFTRTWIYGAYDGRITFYEEMITTDYLRSRPDTCFTIKQPPAVEVAGYYPTQSCVRYDEASGDHTVSMEAFVMREATPRSGLTAVAMPASHTEPSPAAPSQGTPSPTEPSPAESTPNDSSHAAPSH